MAASTALANEALKLVENVEAYLGNQTGHVNSKVKSENLLLQSKIQETRNLQAEWRDKCRELDDLSVKQTQLTTAVPVYITELSTELARARRQKEQDAKELDQLQSQHHQVQGQLQQLKKELQEETEQAQKTVKEQSALLRTWESALALRLESKDGALHCSFTDIDLSFKVRFTDNLVTITAPRVSQARAGAICDKFNESGNLAQLMSSMRRALIEDSR